MGRAETAALLAYHEIGHDAAEAAFVVAVRRRTRQKHDCPHLHRMKSADISCDPQQQQLAGPSGCGRKI